MKAVFGTQMTRMARIFPLFNLWISVLSVSSAFYFYET